MPRRRGKDANAHKASAGTPPHSSARNQRVNRPRSRVDKRQELERHAEGGTENQRIEAKFRNHSE